MIIISGGVAAIIFLIGFDSRNARNENLERPLGEISGLSVKITTVSMRYRNRIVKLNLEDKNCVYENILCKCLWQTPT